MEIIKPNTNMEKARAAYVLDDEISELSILLRRAQVVLEDLCNEYLDVRIDAELLEYYRDSACVRGDIVTEYLYQMSRKLEALNNLNVMKEEVKC